MTQMRYADPRLWSEGGLTIPLKPGATYHLDDNGPPGIEARFDNSSTPMPLGPGATFKVPDGNGMTAFRMGMWRRGAPDFNASVVTHLAPQNGTVPEEFFIRNAQFQIREGWYSGPNGALSGDGPTFEMPLDTANRVIPLLAFFTAAQLARARTLSLDFGTRGVGSADLASNVALNNHLAQFYLRRPGTAGSGIAVSDQLKRLGATIDETAFGARWLWEQVRFCFTGPFSPLDCLHVTSLLNALGPHLSGAARFTLRLHDAWVPEECYGFLTAGFTYAMGQPVRWGAIHVASDRLHEVTCTIAGGATTGSITLYTQRQGASDVAQIAAVAGARRGMALPIYAPQAGQFYLNPTASACVVSTMTLAARERSTYSQTVSTVI